MYKMLHFKVKNDTVQMYHRAAQALTVSEKKR